MDSQECLSILSYAYKIIPMIIMFVQQYKANIIFFTLQLNENSRKRATM